MEKVEVAVIGSSPIMMMWAIKEQSKGHQVVIYEKNSCLGGAWASSLRFGKQIDNGAHFLYYSRKLNKKITHLNDKYALGLKKFDNRPKGDAKFFNNFPEYSFRQTPFDKIERLKFYMNRYVLMRNFLGIMYRNPYYYFSGGSIKLVERLENLFEDKGGLIKKSTEIKSISIQAMKNKHKVSLKSLEGEKLTDRAIISSRAIPNKFYLGQKNIVLKSKSEGEYLGQIYLEIKNPGPSSIPAYKFIDRNIFLVVDTRAHIENNKVQDTAIFIFALQKNIDPESINPSSLLNILISKKMCEVGAEVSDIDTSKVEIINVDKYEVQNLNQTTKGLCEVILYDNMSRAIGEFDI